jgi:hypothetical protein
VGLEKGTENAAELYLLSCFKGTLTILVYINRCKSQLGEGWLSGSAPACYGRSLGSNPDISQKYKMGDISKGVANTL